MLRKKVAAIGAMSFFLSLLIQAVSLIPVMMMPTVIDVYIPAGESGKVVLQTYCPENYILRYAVNYDYEGFFQNEIRLREATFYPPFALVCRVRTVTLWTRTQSAREKPPCGGLGY